ncbi:ABC transporter substrate-binding protein [Ruminococcaceae bacterium OttesenSCG-928-L11]|nr:ABC transporter substrate-binding protein [Ruminococcaceae bacterium OttesenSCG-928-L11]
MKLSKRILSLAMCTALIASLAACGGSTGTTSSTAGSTGGSSTAASSTAPAGSEAQPAAEKDYSKKQVITLASVQIKDGADYTYGDDFVTWWAEKYNIEWDITSLTWDNWAERLRIWINSDDMPDMGVWNYLHGEAANYVDQGLVKKFPDNWKEQWPNLAAAYQDTVMNEGIEEIFDGTYYLFRPVFSGNRPAEKLSPHMTLYVREDWAKAANYELKDAMKLSELVDYFAAVKEADPGNVGANFYPLVVRGGNMGNVMQLASTYSGVGGTPYYLGDDGAYQWGPANEDTLAGLKLYSQMYREGLLHPEFYTLQDPDDKAEFYMTGRSAGMIAEGMAAAMTQNKNHMQNYLSIDWDEVVRPVTVLGEDGKYHGNVVTNFWAANIFSPHIEDEKFERLMDMMDYASTEEGQMLIRMGFEGTDWERGANGELFSLLEEGIVLNDKYNIHPVYGNLFILSDDFQFISPYFYENHRAKVKEMYLLRESLSDDKSLPAEPDWNVHFHDSQALNLASMVYSDEYASLVVKDGDIEANWQAWVNEKMNMIQPVLDELNAKR